jgi:MFS family permease
VTRLRTRRRPAAPPLIPHEPAAGPSRQSLAGLDWLNFFVANLQTGFGPFLSVYLTTKAWTQVDIGLALTAGSLVSLAVQAPAGALVDAARSKHAVAGIAILAISASALFLAVWPVFLVVLAAQLVHGVASCLLGPAMAAISLGLVGHARVGERLGRNARFGSIGNGSAAALMGVVGRYVSNQAVFFLTAALGLPALWALGRIRPQEIDPLRARGGTRHPLAGVPAAALPRLIHNRPLWTFAGCVLLFHLANAAMLPLMAGVITTRSSDRAPILIAACIVVPQLVVALISPWIGRQAERWGRRPLLIAGFAALPLRAALVAAISSPYLLVGVQVLDGISAAMLGVLFPLVTADAVRGTGRFNFAQGVLGSALGIGASLSTTLGGYLIDHLGKGFAFLVLAGIGLAAVASVAAFLPETRPSGLT